MDDLISRRAAIDALKEHEDCKGYLHGDFETILEALPSAQQELNTALYVDGFCDGYKQGKKDAIEERHTGKWRAFKIGECDLIECTACKVARPREEMPTRNGGKIAWKYCPECGAKMEE